MTPEQKLWAQLKEAMDPWWLADRIESRTTNGIPDVAFTIVHFHGWIELKTATLSADKTKYKLRYPLTERQKHWIHTRGRHTEKVFILIRVDFSKNYSEFYLMPWCDVFELNKNTMIHLENKSLYASPGRLDGMTFARALERAPR